MDRHQDRGTERRDGALRQLEQSLERLQTDHVDEWRLHNVWDFEELDRCFAPGGAIEAMVQAKTQGMVRNISISGHTDPRVQVEALRRFPFDSVLWPPRPWTISSTASPRSSCRWPTPGALPPSA